MRNSNCFCLLLKGKNSCLCSSLSEQCTDVKRQMGGPNTTWLPSKQALVVNNWNSCWITLEIIHALLLVFIKPMVYFSYVGNKCATPLILISCFSKLVYLCVWIFLNIFFLMTFFFFSFFFFELWIYNLDQVFTPDRTLLTTFGFM